MKSSAHREAPCKLIWYRCKVSKKTNAEKQRRRRAKSLLRRAHPRRGLQSNPLVVSKAVEEATIDLFLGQAFVQVLRGLGVRDQIKQIIIEYRPPIAEGAD